MKRIHKTEDSQTIPEQYKVPLSAKWGFGYDSSAKGEKCAKEEAEGVRLRGNFV